MTQQPNTLSREEIADGLREVREDLAILIAAKDEKDANGESERYHELKRNAWGNARRALGALPALIAAVEALEARQMVRTRIRIELPRALLNEAAKPPYQKILAFTSLGNMLFDLLERAGLNPQIDADVEARPHEFSAFFVDVYKGSAGRSKPGTVVTGKLVVEGGDDAAAPYLSKSFDGSSS